jgi:hypothetical protein
VTVSARSRISYDATVTTKQYIWLTAGIVAFGLAVALVGSIFVVLGMFLNEDWCADRSPWWGPPESGTDPYCSGHSWESDHPGEFPWTMPK